MFGEMDLDGGVASAPSPIAKVLPKSVEVQQEVVVLDALSFGDLDALMEESSRWKNVYRVGEGVEAMYLEDGLWYVACINEVLEESKLYRLTFTEYGNVQDTPEDQIRLPLQALMQKKEEELAPAVAAEEARKAKRRSTFLANSPDAIVAKPSIAGPSADLLVRCNSMSAISSRFDQIVNPNAAPEEVPSRSSSGGRAGGVMTAEERKALIFAEARKLGMESKSERRFVDVGGNNAPVKTSLSDRHLEEKRQKEKKGGNRSNSFSTGGSGGGGGGELNGTGLNVGDVGMLLDVEEARRARSASVAAAESDRKVWADNALGK
jgi:hypothetical protein